MPSRVDREAVDLSSYPDLVVVYLGMRVNRLYGLRTLIARGPRIDRSGDQPEGLLAWVIHGDHQLVDPTGV